ncbi:hypothetical protein [Ruminococcus sp.]|uniref:hypothetical protein n=1 Tax=Ruminococcus sp. TaxID=41978 RepID=UPI00388F975A
MKKLISLLLIAVLASCALALTACQSNEKSAATEAATVDEAPVSIPDGVTPISIDAEGNASGYSKEERDENGRVTRRYTYDSMGKFVSSIGYEFDKSGFASKEIHYAEDGSIESQSLFERNEEGLITKRTELDGSGKTVGITVKEYNDHGFETVIYEYDGDNKLLNYKKYEYNSDDEMTKMTLYKADDTVEYSITYDNAEDGSVIEKKYDADGNLISK